MKTTSLRRFGAAVTLAAVSLATVFASVTAVADTTKPLLFKIVTVKDDVIVAVPPDEAGAPRPEAAAIGQALAAKGALTFCKAADGALEMAPRAKISVLAHDSLRVEPYTPAVRVVPVP
ncbi:MAG: hypothetical protein ABS37_19965 [Acidovorax sp. SCN 65-108]|nr:MAG: hypothetical protein ABS37_19965 [Acidovorax sp. SCN 65-108]